MKKTRRKNWWVLFGVNGWPLEIGYSKEDVLEHYFGYLGFDPTHARWEKFKEAGFTVKKVRLENVK